MVFAGSSTGIVVLAFRDMGTAFWVSCAVTAACFVMAILSPAMLLAATSPRLGRRVLHDSGVYYFDLSVERYSSHIVKTRMVVYRDRVLYKSRVHTCELTDLSDESIVHELGSCLRNLEGEMRLRDRIRRISSSPINLLSVERNRESRISDLFRK